MTWRTSCHFVAPSSAAASNVSGGMFMSPARKTRALNGMTAKELTKATDMRAQYWSYRNGIGSSRRPRPRTIVLNRPRSPRRNFHTLPLTTGGRAHTKTMRARSAADQRPFVRSAIAAAIALRTKGPWSAALLALMVFVWALPPVVNGSVWKFLLGDRGLFNTIVLGLGLREDPMPFLYDQYWALMSVAFVNSFAVIPFNALVFRAGLMNIPPETFEAAALDGATKWQEVRHVMLPAVRPTTLVLLVLTIVYGFRSFDFIYVMTYGGPGTATNTLPFLGYLQAFARYDFGLGAATSVVTVLGVLVLAAVYARSIRREEAES